MSVEPTPSPSLITFCISPPTQNPCYTTTTVDILYQTTRSMPQALIGVILICKGLQIYSIVHWVEAWKQGLPTMYGITKLDQGFEFCWLKKCYNLSCFI